MKRWVLLNVVRNRVYGCFMRTDSFNVSIRNNLFKVTESRFSSYRTQIAFDRYFWHNLQHSLEKKNCIYICIYI